MKINKGIFNGALDKLGKFFEMEPPEFNMPKSQPCPKCGSWVGRTKKIDGGAIYQCGQHGDFELSGK
jgi:hypothetical protein